MASTSQVLLLSTFTIQPPSTQTTIPCSWILALPPFFGAYLLSCLHFKWEPEHTLPTLKTINSRHINKGAKPHLPHMWFSKLNTCIIFLNVKASATHSYNQGQEKRTSCNQRLYPVKPAKLCRQTGKKKRKQNKLLYIHSNHLCTNASLLPKSLTAETAGYYKKYAFLVGVNLIERGSRWQCTHFFLLLPNVNILNSIIKMSPFDQYVWQEQVK